MGWEGAGAFKSLFKSLTKPRKALKFGDEAKHLRKLCMPLDCNRPRWVHSLTFMSSNLTCYHAEFTNTACFFLPLLCKPTEVPELLHKIPGVCRKRLAARENPSTGTEVRNHSLRQGEKLASQRALLVEDSCLSLSLCAYCPHSSTVGKDIWALLRLTRAKLTRLMPCADK